MRKWIGIIWFLIKPMHPPPHEDTYGMFYTVEHPEAPERD